MRTILSTINLKSTKEYPKPTYLTISPAPAYPSQVAERSRTEPPYNLKSAKIRESKEVARGVGKWDAKVEGMGGWGLWLEKWRDGKMEMKRGGEGGEEARRARVKT